MRLILRWICAKMGYELVKKVSEVENLKVAVAEALTSCPIYCVDGNSGIGYRVMYVGFHKQEANDNEKLSMQIGLDGKDCICVTCAGEQIDGEQDGGAWLS